MSKRQEYQTDLIREIIDRSLSELKDPLCTLDFVRGYADYEISWMEAARDFFLAPFKAVRVLFNGVYKLATDNRKERGYLERARKFWDQQDSLDEIEDKFRLKGKKK